jgi:hypothetical protein
VNIIGNLRFCQQALKLLRRTRNDQTFPFNVVAAKSFASTAAFSDCRIKWAVVHASGCKYRDSSQRLPTSGPVPLLQGYPASPVTNPAIIQLSLKADESHLQLHLPISFSPPTKKQEYPNKDQPISETVPGTV